MKTQQPKAQQRKRKPKWKQPYDVEDPCLKCRKEALQQKGRLLSNAAGKPVRQLAQFDYCQASQDITSGMSLELRRTGAEIPVRVFVWPLSDKMAAAKHLRAIADLIEKQGLDPDDGAYAF